MAKLVINSYEEFASHLGEKLGESDWLQIDQDRINKFADATLDPQWIHVDVERAKVDPASLLANEIQLKCGDKVLRADSVLYSRELQPRMIIEYKAPHIPITQKVFDQISVYNLLLHVDFLVVSNGLEHYICKMDYESKKYVFLETIPDYSDLLTL